jgi:ABC-type phosphate transport system substrate-binding protein
VRYPRSGALGIIGVAVLLAGLVAAAEVVAPVSSAGADTDPTTLAGQGGSFLEPMMSKLLGDDTASLSPLYGTYLQTDDNSGIAAFVGSASGQFTADFTVTQRPLTSTESTQATTDGRSYAYVPFAATPVAIATLVPTFTWSNSGSTSITSSGFCQNIPLTVDQLGELVGDELISAPPLPNWETSTINCPGGGGPGGNSAGSYPVAPLANLDPSMSNDAVMALLDSDPTAKASLDAALNGTNSLTPSDTPSELWPFAGDTTPGGDQPLIGKLLDLNAETNAPSTTAGFWALGGFAPISSVWTGAPLGVAWDLPTASIQNAAGAFVGPTLAAAQAAQSDATLASTSDPTTDNLVTFAASTTDSAAYNNYLMEESYLVVPTDGLSQAKATALAQVIRFILGKTGQQDIENFGSAPATPAMQAAGLKVATELNTAAATAANTTAASGSSSTTSTTTTAAAGSTTTSTTAGGTATAGTSGGADDSSGDGAGTTAASTGGLAFTGTAHLGMWVATGLVMIGAGMEMRRRLKRRERHS